MVENIAIVVAIANDNAIGVGNDLLLHIPGDLPRFKALTTGGTVVMGRKTFDSLPKGALPNRRNIVITRNKSIELPNCELAYSVDEVLQMIKPNEQVYIIGGGEIYKEFLPIAKRLILTVVEKSFPNADTFFPTINFQDYHLLQEEIVKIECPDVYVVRYQTWEKIN